MKIAEQKRGTLAFPNGFGLTLRPHKLLDPIKWKTPSMIFVNSMSDLFHREIPLDYIAQVWDTMLRADHHIYQILTKRTHRMAHILRTMEVPIPEHIWLGTSVENQTFADSRIPALLSIPAPVRFLSAEPLLGPLDLSRYLPGLHWTIDGGESGPHRRPANPDWFRAIRDQCIMAGVPYLHKQGNAFRSGQDRELDGRTWDEYPNFGPQAARRDFSEAEPTQAALI
jgi:protein gp37